MSIHFLSVVAAEDWSMISGKDQFFRCPWGSKGASSGRKVYAPRSEHCLSRPVDTGCLDSSLFSWLSIPLTFSGYTTKNRQEWGSVLGKNALQLSLPLPLPLPLRHL